jgi:hypothetical protein
MINKEIQISDNLTFNPWQINTGGYWLRYVRYHWIHEETVNSRISISPGPAFNIQFIARAKIFEELFTNQNKAHKYDKVEDIKEHIDQFLIKISKLKSFI